MTNAIKVKVKADANENKVVYDAQTSVYKVFVKAKAEKGEANKAVLNLLAKTFKKRAKIISGYTSKEKLVRLF